MNVGDQFVEFYDGDPQGYAYTVTRIEEDKNRFYAAPHDADLEHAFTLYNHSDHLVAPCTDCDGVCLTFYAAEKVYKCEECGNEWD